MANESPLLHDGWNVSNVDFRNGSVTGTTRLGPSGSGQFLAVRLSTSADNTIVACTAAGAHAYGILQNKPSTGVAADVGFFGVSKAVAGSTTVVSGIDLMVDSSGCLIPYTTSSGQYRFGLAKTTPSAVGEVFTAFVYGCGGYFG